MEFVNELTNESMEPQRNVFFSLLDLFVLF